jgi:hypothetical protein
MNNKTAIPPNEGRVSSQRREATPANVRSPSSRSVSLIRMSAYLVSDKHFRAPRVKTGVRRSRQHRRRLIHPLQTQGEGTVEGYLPIRRRLLRTITASSESTTRQRILHARTYITPVTAEKSPQARCRLHLPANVMASTTPTTALCHFTHLVTMRPINTTSGCQNPATSRIRRLCASMSASNSTPDPKWVYRHLRILIQLRMYLCRCTRNQSTPRICKRPEP